jgi:ubiquinone/menaquinone biosynthesis C-methylase UbiE
MNVLDVGCGMGFFSLPIARLVGETGRVVCVDLQARMIKCLLRRAKKALPEGRAKG